jgi:hypothetical protein
MKHAFVIISCSLLCACSGHGVEKFEVHAKLIELSGSSVKLVLNAAHDPICVSAADLSPHYGRIRIFDNKGREIQRSNSTNREMQSYKGMDIADGVLVGSAGRAKTILISLSEFEADGKRPVRGYVELSYSPCSLLFGSGNSPVRSMRVDF